MLGRSVFLYTNLHFSLDSKLLHACLSHLLLQNGLCSLQDDMIKQRAVDAGYLEVRRLLQGGSMSRNAPPVSSIPPPDQMSGFGSVGGQPLQAPVQMQQAMPALHGQFAHQTGSVQQAPELAQTVALYVGVDAPPHFNLHQRLRGPGKLCSLCFAHGKLCALQCDMEPEVLTSRDVVDNG